MIEIKGQTFWAFPFFKQIDLKSQYILLKHFSYDWTGQEGDDWSYWKCDECGKEIEKVGGSYIDHAEKAIRHYMKNHN